MVLYLESILNKNVTEKVTHSKRGLSPLYKQDKNLLFSSLCATTLQLILKITLKSNIMKKCLLFMSGYLIMLIISTAFLEEEFTDRIQIADHEVNQYLPENDGIDKTSNETDSLRYGVAQLYKKPIIDLYK